MPDEPHEPGHPEGPEGEATRDPRSPRPPEDATRTTGGEPTQDSRVPEAGDGSERTAAIPESIGPYRILGVLGEGGMGIVYEAEQASPRRLVALKVVRGGQFVDEARVRMFQREAETLARLKHPNIGAIYESGRTEDGQHFFAMEFVRGEHLGHWLSRRTGPLDAVELKLRLRLFRKICDAVHYAHQRGVIHRDLKPSNIVIGEVPEAVSTAATLTSAPTPEVKILDFGLARITDTDMNVATVLTEVGMIKGTLPYMSPEQARGDADEVDLRTDVYALGIILYEILSGKRPYDTDRSALLEAVRVICEDPPRPLSQSWSGLRRLDRDVETIVGKALEKEADRRYGSAAAFSEDVERYLGSQPILAHPPSATYQMRKFAQRNRGLVIGAAAVLAALVLGLVTTTWGFRRAREEAALSNQIAAFMKEMLEGAGPHVAQGADATLLRGILERTGDRIESELEGQPRVEAELRDTIGQTYMEIGDYDEAEEHLVRSHLLTLETLGEDHLKTMDAVRHLGILRSHQGQRAEAEELYLRALEAHERKGSMDSSSAVAVQHSLGVLYLETGRAGEAVEILEKCVEARKRLLGAEDDHTFQSMSGLGLALLREDRGEEAEAQLGAVLEGRRRVFGETHPFTIEAIHNLAGLYSEVQRFDEAEALFLEALGQMEAVYGEAHPRTIRVRGVVGTAYLQMQRIEEAEDHLTRTLAESLEILGGDHPTTLMAQQRMARLREFQRRPEQAEDLLRDLLERRRRISGGNHPHTLAAMLSTMQFLKRQRRYEEAEPLGVELVEKARERWGDEHRDPLLYLNELAHVYAAMKRYEDAERTYQEALEGRRRLLGEDHPHTLVSMNSLAVLYMRQGDYARAVPQLGQTLERQRESIGPDHPDTIISLYNLAHAHNELGEVEKAEELFLGCAEGFEKSLGDQHGNTRAARKALVKLYEKQGRAEEAARWRALLPPE